MRTRLFTPGPTQIPERVQVAMSQPIMHHRGTEFKQIFQEVLSDLKYFFQTSGEVVVLTSSGTGAMEAGLANLLCRGETILTVAGGKFGERWGQMGAAFGANTHTIEVPWGTAVDPQEIQRFLQAHPETAVVCATHSETSTGVAHDIRAIAEIVRAHSKALLLVDAITSAGVMPFKMDEWGIDVAVTGSQKGLMLPPGLAVVAYNDRAWRKIKGSDVPKFYFDLTKESAALKNTNTAWTPAVSLVMGLAESLKMIREQGLENVWARHALLARATRKGVVALGLELFAQSPSNSLTSVKLPGSIEGLAFNKHLREKYGVTVAGGQAQLKGKIFRIAHMGHYDELDMIALISALEMTLADFNWEFKPGCGVTTVQNVFLNSKNQSQNTE
ncbi:MAG: pyridoxal-phosphate-dependent aminotransferase family protein [bacterium]